MAEAAEIRAYDPPCLRPHIMKGVEGGARPHYCRQRSPTACAATSLPECQMTSTANPGPAPERYATGTLC